MSKVYIGRQPIFDGEMNVVAYELLYRSGEVNQAQFLDGNQATSSVISNTFLEIGLSRLVGDKLGFINLTRQFVLGQFPIPKHYDQLVLEILEDITIDDELVEHIGRLRDEGFTIALDDVVNVQDVVRILPLAHIVKVDLMNCNRKLLAQQIQAYKTHQIKLLAEKIENQEEYEWCKALGFDYFQGYFLCKPRIIQEKKLSGTRMVILQLIAELQRTDVEFSEIEALIHRDVALSYKLLRLINSAYYATRSEIKSIKQAITLLGLKQIRSWISLLLLSESDEQPTELMKIAMIRAKMMELMSHAAHRAQPEAAFTIGLFSVLDAMLNMPLDAILKQVPLSDEIKTALLERQNEMGHMLNCVLAYEEGDWDAVSHPGIPADTLLNCYMDAVMWAEETVQLLSS